MLANLDYAVTGNAEVRLLECKTAGEYGAKLAGWRATICTVPGAASAGCYRQAGGAYLRADLRP